MQARFIKDVSYVSDLVDALCKDITSIDSASTGVALEELEAERRAWSAELMRVAGMCAALKKIPSKDPTLDIPSYAEDRIYAALEIIWEIANLQIKITVQEKLRASLTSHYAGIKAGRIAASKEHDRTPFSDIELAVRSQLIVDFINKLKQEVRALSEHWASRGSDGNALAVFRYLIESHAKAETIAPAQRRLQTLLQDIEADISDWQTKIDRLAVTAEPPARGKSTPAITKESHSAARVATVTGKLLSSSGPARVTSGAPRARVAVLKTGSKPAVSSPLARP